MKITRRLSAWSLAGLGLVLASLTGCQTYMAGMTLPSGRYLQHPPQFFPSDPDFPLEKEVATMEKNNAAGLPGGPAAPGSLPMPAARP